MKRGRSHQFAEVQRNRSLVRFSCRFEVSTVHGYVLDVGPAFFLLALVNDGVRFDGFRCFRIRDIDNLMPDPYGAFAESALKKRGERLPKKPRVNVESISELLLSAARAFPLVTIHREEIDPDVCWIGRVLETRRGHVSLQEIQPGAIWEERANDYLLSEITRVDFGGGYEDALHLVGGSPPEPNPHRSD